MYFSIHQYVFGLSFFCLLSVKQLTDNRYKLRLLLFIWAVSLLRQHVECILGESEVSPPGAFHARARYIHDPRDTPMWAPWSRGPHQLLISQHTEMHILNQEKITFIDNEITIFIVLFSYKIPQRSVVSSWDYFFFPL